MKQTDARATRSRLALLEAGLELFLQKPTATLSEVAVHAGVGRATLYRHFDTKESLIRALALDCLDATEKIVAPIYAKDLNPTDKLKAMLVAIIPLADRYHFLLSLWNIAADDQKLLEIYNKQLDELSELVELGKRQGLFKKHLNTGWIVTTIDSLIYSSWWMLSQKQMTEKEVIAQISETLLDGISQ